MGDCLLLSLDGKKWSTQVSINKGNYNDTNVVYPGNTNSWTTGLIPMSTVGNMDKNSSRMILFEKASFTATKGGYRVMASRVDNYTSDEHKGYVAFDLFIKNFSGTQYIKNYNPLDEEAIFLTRFCSSVKIIHRRNEFRASKIMSDRVLANAKIEPIWDSVLEEVLKDDTGVCRAAVVKNVKTGELREIPCACVFVAIGHVPNTKAFVGAVDMDADGYIKAKDNTIVRTNVDNVFVAGDCADRIFQQAITASAMGCMAAILATQH